MGTAYSQSQRVRPTVVGRIMPLPSLQDGHFQSLEPVTVMLHDKGELTEQMDLRLLIVDLQVGPSREGPL